jgi:hypothetical protein
MGLVTEHLKIAVLYQFVEAHKDPFGYPIPQDNVDAVGLNIEPLPNFICTESTEYQAL